MPVLVFEEWLRPFVREVFEACGSPAAEASLVAEHLVTASLLGYDTHGIIRIPQYVEDVRKGAIKPGAPLRIERETETTAVVACGWNFGQVGGLRGMEVAMEKASRYHTATVVVRECSHAGRLGTFTSHAAERGFLAIGVCNSPIHGHFVTPWGGRQGRLATNPISFAIPANGGPPIVADFSTAEASEGAIRLHRNQGRPLPDGWIVDAEGQPSNDPADFYGPPQGAIFPFGGRRGYRGFALGLLVEVLGGLMGGSPVTKRQPGNGLGFIVIDVSPFVAMDQFAEMILELRDYIKSAGVAPGFEEIYLPGEPDRATRQRRQREGIPVDDSTWRQIEAAAASVGVSAPLSSLKGTA